MTHHRERTGIVAGIALDVVDIVYQLNVTRVRSGKENSNAGSM
jgi:hypothetical protein